MYTLSDITDKVHSLLATAFTGTNVNVHQAYYLPIESDSLPAVVVYPKGDSAIETFEDNTSHRQGNFIIEIRAIGLPPISTIKPISDKIVKTLFTNSSLDGMATNMMLVSQTYDGAILDKEYSACAIELEIGYIFSPIAQG